MDKPLYVLRDRILINVNPNLDTPNRSILYSIHNESFLELARFLDDVGRSLCPNNPEERFL